MGAQPKKKMSHRRKNMRRSHDRAAFGQINLCSHCRRPAISHHVCPHCGYYAGREVVPLNVTRTAESTLLTGWDGSPERLLSLPAPPRV